MPGTRRSRAVKPKKDPTEELADRPPKRPKLSATSPEAEEEVMVDKHGPEKKVAIELVDRKANKTPLATYQVDISSILESAVAEMQAACANEHHQPNTRRKQLLDMARSKAETRASRMQRKTTSFLDLPESIRRDIYRMVFYTDRIVDFEARKGFERSGQFLRTCNLINIEGRSILYGANSFHFGRTNDNRGRFYEENWDDIGYKDILAFLEMIGTHNIALLKFVSFIFSDPPVRHSANRSLSRQERAVYKQEKRFVNDACLHQSLRIIGQHAILEKVAVTFSSKTALKTTDIHFLNALATIKTYEVVHASPFWYSSNDRNNAFAETKKRMLLTRPEEVNTKKKKILARPMWHEPLARGTT